MARNSGSQWRSIACGLSAVCAARRSRRCAAPSVRSIVRPITRVCSDASSIAVNASESRSTASTSSQRVTSQRLAASTHTTPSSRSRR